VRRVLATLGTTRAATERLNAQLFRRCRSARPGAADGNCLQAQT
jgi:hypothetical protein